MKNTTKALKWVLRFSFLLLISIPAYSQRKANPTRGEVLNAMKKASDYMVNTISCHGGYVWLYTEDLTRRDGEVPARESQIMTYGPGTQEMGLLFLDLYEATGDDNYLDYAKKAADALIYGQHPLGGWHYFIDFDSKDIEEWYKQVASKFPGGYEEYRHYYGNCTYDDGATQEPTAFLLRLYTTTLLPEYLEPLKKALNFMLISQYPNGGWPQRYPLRYEAVHDGLPDYTSYYTLNDNAMTNTINVLIDAYEQLGDERYLEAAKRGTDFFMLIQGPTGHAGWAEQYNMDLQPSQSRTHEPGGYMARQTVVTINSLEKMFLFTGDRRYLRPIPAALEWLETSKIEVLEDGRYKYARYYDPETNIPINIERSGISKEGYILYHIYNDDRQPFAGWNHSFDLKPVKEQYEQVKGTETRAEERKLYDELFRAKSRKVEKPDAEEVHELIQAQNEKGIWIEEISMWDFTYGQMTEGRINVPGISTSTFIDHMRKMMAYLESY